MVNPIAYIIIITLIFVFIKILHVVYKYLHSPTFSRKWRIVFILLSIMGTLLGYWSSTTKYPVGDKLKVGGFPIPLVFFADEGEGDTELWIDFVPPTHIQLLALLLNILIITSVLVTFLFFAAYIVKRRTRLQEANSCGPPAMEWWALR